MAAIPSTMRALQLHAYDAKASSIRVAQVPVPTPGRGEVLVRIAASPVNPSDLMFVAGMYGFKKPVPAIPGFEGSGNVVKAGPGAMPRFLLGKRVACAAADARIAGGTWAEYLVTSAQFCIPLRKNIDIEQAATMLVNPMTAWALVEEARRGGHRAAVQTAAASALGQMVVRLGRRFSLPIINIVRRPEQVELLRTIGAEHIVNSSEFGYENSLKLLCQDLGATIGFDAVAGETSAIVLRAQPNGARLLVYGGLSLAACQADPTSLIFEGKRLEGFWLSGWLRNKNLLSQLRVARQVQALLSTDLKTEIRARVPLEQTAAALSEYAQHMTGGKVLIVPQQS